MCNIASELSDEEAQALAEYFAGQPPCAKRKPGE
jgi:cytochrome c553